MAIVNLIDIREDAKGCRYANGAYVKENYNVGKSIFGFGYVVRLFNDQWLSYGAG